MLVKSTTERKNIFGHDPGIYSHLVPSPFKIKWNTVLWLDQTKMCYTFKNFGIIIKRNYIEILLQEKDQWTIPTHTYRCEDTRACTSEQAQLC